jgi:murein DD-endopeptidase MepM/ murein hydrolase activator NlpD
VHSPGSGLVVTVAPGNGRPVLRTAALGLLLTAVLAGPPAGLPPGAPATATRVPVAAWTAPVDGVLQVTRPFDLPAQRWRAGHRGVDLAAAPGTPVRAAGDGVVLFAGLVAGRPVVSIAHADGLRTTYEPVAPAVGAGQRISAGTVLGTLVPGHAGCPATACLHWGLLRGETYLDPLLLLRPPRLRLLPPEPGD